MDAASEPQPYHAHLQTVIFDLSGTVVDFGSCAPIRAFRRLFADLGIDITEAQAREPMGSEKRTHIARLLAMPAIQAQWQAAYGQAATDLDVERLYQIFKPLQKAAVLDALDPVPGAIDVLHQLPGRGLRVAFNTGYSRSMAQPVLDRLAQAGVYPASVVCGTEVPMARPAPHMALRNAIDSGATSVQACVKVDDAESGVTEGRNAGMWSIGVAVSGNAVGLAHDDWLALDDADRSGRRAAAEGHLRDAGAHFVLDSVADLLPCLDEIERRMAAGERP